MSKLEFFPVPSVFEGRVNYPVKVYLTKRFISGILKGCTFNYEMGFCTDADATDYLKWAKKGPHKGVMTKDKWEIIDCSFQKYWRY